MHLQDVVARPVRSSEEIRFQALMQSHHYLGALPKIGNTLWYVGTWEGPAKLFRRGFEVRVMSGFWPKVTLRKSHTINKLWI